MPEDSAAPPPATATDSPSGKEHPLVASPESQTPALSAVTEDLDHEEPQLEEESPGWENEDGSTATSTTTTTSSRNHFRIRHDDPMRGSFMQLLRGRPASQQPSRGAGGSGGDDVHPIVQTLGLRDLESCWALETAAFPEHERESRETITYRLTTAPELTLGLFSTMPPPPSSSSSSSTTTITTSSSLPPTYYATAHPADSTTPDKKAVLIAMLLATKTATPTATDAARCIPAGWHPHQPFSYSFSSSHPSSNNTTNNNNTNNNNNNNNNNDNPPPQGHDPTGRTLLLWTLAVHPAYQRRGLGRTLLKSYQQRMDTSRIADRIAVLARAGEGDGGGGGVVVGGEMDKEEKEGGEGGVMGLLKEVGFVDRGVSGARFAGGGWRDMVFEFGPPRREAGEG